MICDSCKYYNRGRDEYPCNNCVHNAVEKYKRMTNIDRIKAMSVEELAQFICNVYDKDEDHAKFINGTIIPCYTEEDVIEWLEREVDEDDFQ